MELSARESIEALRRKGVGRLYHANTVRTACAFLREGALLSRGAAEDLGYAQTPQYSDALDKEFGIWHDIFLDTVDIHRRARLRNKYGPVLFEFDLSLLARDDLPEVWITRDNPIRWTRNTPLESRYFGTVAEFEQAYTYGDFDKHITLRGSGGRLEFGDQLTGIFVDATPRRIEDTWAYDAAVESLVAAAAVGELQLPTEFFRRHECRFGCACNAEYARLSNEDFSALFAL